LKGMEIPIVVAKEIAASYTSSGTQKLLPRNQKKSCNLNRKQHECGDFGGDNEKANILDGFCS